MELSNKNKDYADFILKANKVYGTNQAERLKKLFEEAGELTEAIINRTNPEMLLGDKLGEANFHVLEEIGDMIFILAHIASFYGEDLEYCFNWANIKFTMRQVFEGKANEWFYGQPFTMLEKIFGVYQSDYSPEEGYREFVDFCKAEWDKLPIERRKAIMNEAAQNS